MKADFADLPPDATRHAIATAEPVGGWPDPLPLPGGLLPVPAFDLDLLPSELRPWVGDIAERMNCPADYVAIPAMVAAGSLIGRRVGIRPQRKTDWQEAGNLWGCIVGPPGALKSPAVREATAPLMRLEARAIEANRAGARDHEIEMSLHKLQTDAAMADAKKALRDKNCPDPRADALASLSRVAEPDRPPEKRFLIHDATVERLGEICADNPHGVMVARDELLTLFAELDREEKTSARGFFLTGWSGRDGYTFDRIGRGRTHCPAINLSLFGTTQPTRLTGYMRQSLASMNDGMVQRLQLLSWPDLGGEFREVDRYPDSDAKAAAFACYDRLAALDAPSVGAEMDAFGDEKAFPFLRFEDDARESFSEWWAKLERKVRGDDLPPAFIAHLSKYRGLIPRLALLCHLASGGTGPVTVKAAATALRWGNYLEAHAWRAYSSLGVASAESARAIWRKVKQDQLPRPFTARDIQRKGWSGLSDKADVTAGLTTLADADWIIPQEVQTGGRPSTVYVPNPLALAR